MRENRLENEIFNVTKDKFNELSAKIFSYQCNNTPVFAQWNAVYPGREGKIPYLPIGFFKQYQVKNALLDSEVVFESSSTSGTGVSSHHVPFADFYEANFMAAFRQFYGNPKDYCILALLPAYLERTGSSLVYMADKLIQQAATGSGFYLNNHTDLLVQLAHNEAHGQKTLLLGVSFALLDVAEVYTGKPLQHTIIMETGGMKGRRKELTREELHTTLCKAFGLAEIHSEYGMTELMSQAYSKGNGIFECPPWMQVHVEDVNDPGTRLDFGITGRICITDLGNLYSCSFIATDDLGKVYPDGSFEVLGRMDFSDTRGCNLMVG